MNENIFDHIVEVTGFERHPIKCIVFALIFGSLKDKTIFEVARSFGFELTDIVSIRGAADEWLMGKHDEVV